MSALLDAFDRQLRRDVVGGEHDDEVVIWIDDGWHGVISRERETVEALVSLHQRVFGEGHGAIGRALEQNPPPSVGVVCFASGGAISAARIEFPPGSEFATSWGGCTLPEWRGRGAYRATVARRAQLARTRGYRYLVVDAIPASRPILERLGFVALTKTTPYTPA